MNRRTLIQTLLATLPILFLSRKRPVELHQRTVTFLPTPLLVTRSLDGDKFVCKVPITNPEGKVIGDFQIKYFVKDKELFFVLQAYREEEVSCLVYEQVKFRGKHSELYSGRVAGQYKVKML